jgi:isopenicillin N synthase-like dioxygenase
MMHLRILLGLAAGYSVVAQPDREIGGTLGAHVTSFNVDLAGQGSVNGGGVDLESRRRAVLAPLPTLGLHADWSPARRLMLSARADALSLKIGDYRGRLLAAQIGASYEIAKLASSALSVPKHLLSSASLSCAPLASKRSSWSIRRATAAARRATRRVSAVDEFPVSGIYRCPCAPRDAMARRMPSKSAKACLNYRHIPISPLENLSRLRKGDAILPARRYGWSGICDSRRTEPMRNSAIPVIDISSFHGGSAEEKHSVAQAVCRACEELGFLIVSGHGVADELIAEMRRVSKDFFDQPDSSKLRYKMPPDRYRGYISVGSEALANTLDEATPPDIKESFSIGPIDTPDDDYHRAARPGNFFAPNIWPDTDQSFRSTWTEYYRSMESLSASLMRIFAVGLGLAEDYFADKIDHHISNFSVIHYPGQLTPPLPGQLRAGAHTDYGSLTIVKPDCAEGGLQVLAKDGSWMDVPYVADAFVVNLGDLMAEWTNDRWVSTLHRVVNPPLSAGHAARRLSMTFFHQPNYDAVIDCIPTCTGPDNPPRYEKTTSGEHVWMKVNKHRAPELSQRT